MRNLTRAIFNQYLAEVAEINGLGEGFVSAAGMQPFSVDPTVEQALEEIILEQVGFLSHINMPFVDRPMGQRLLMGHPQTLAGTQDTTAGDRKVTQLGGPANKDQYHCQQTNFDTAIRYALVDRWAKFPDFAAKLAAFVAKQMGRDRIMVGWHGKQRAATSDRAANPMLSDVGEGWLKKLATNAPSQILSEGANAGELRIGKGGDYENLDAAVFDIHGEKIHEVHQEDTELVAIVGRELLHDKYLGLVSSNETATERVALDIVMSTRQVGGIPAIKVPFFPKRGIMITALSNLSIYLQEDTTRRTITDNAKRDQVEDYQSVNMDWMIEDYTACAYVDGDNVKVRTNASSAANATWG